VPAWHVRRHLPLP